jgi:hypothetical protein
MAKAGRYGGTYAHKDIAFEFGTIQSPHIVPADSPFKILSIPPSRKKENEE